MNDSFETAFILLKERNKIIRTTTTQAVNTIECTAVSVHSSKSLPVAYKHCGFTSLKPVELFPLLLNSSWKKATTVVQPEMLSAKT